MVPNFLNRSAINLIRRKKQKRASGEEQPVTSIQQPESNIVDLGMLTLKNCWKKCKKECRLLRTPS
jgi:hypothetical protein